MALITVDSYSESNKDINLGVGNGTQIKRGQAFACSQNCTLAACQFYLSKTGTPPGNMNAAIYAITGTFGTNSTGTGTALATSGVVTANSLTGSFALTTFTFSGVNLISLSGGVNYVVALEYSAGDGSNSVTVGADNSSSTHAGNSCSYISSWLSSANDTCFYVTANTTVIYFDTDQ